MLLEAAVRAKLLASAPVTALVGDRVGPENVVRSSDKPYVVIQRTSDDGEVGTTKSGFGAWIKASVNCKCVADTHDGAKELAVKVRAALGTATNADGITSVIPSVGGDDVVVGGDGSDVARWAASVSFTIGFREE